MKLNNWLITSAIIMALGVAMGAIGAHALKNSLTETELNLWNKGILYHLIHGIGLLFLYLIAKTNEQLNLKWCFYLLSFGILFFSGSLYLIAINKGIFGEIQFIKYAMIPSTPIVGICFIAGWIILLIKLKQ